MRPRTITALFSCLPLSGFEESLISIDAKQMARDPEYSIHHCPWGSSRDPLTRARRICWRLAFRCERERIEGPLSTLVEGRAAA